MPRAPLPFDPVAEARRHWDARWKGGESMAAATSLVRASEIVVDAIDDVLREFDLTFPRYEALVLLSFSSKGELPLGKMGERLLIHPANITNIVDRLQAQGFVERRPHQTDRRTTLAGITDAGRRVLEQATAALTDAKFGLDALGEPARAHLTDLTRDIRSAAGDFAD